MELLHDARTMGLDGLLADAELVRDGLVRFTGENAVEHMALSLSQQRQRKRRHEGPKLMTLSYLR